MRCFGGIVTIAALVALSGCGGGGADDTSAAERRAALTRWVQQADAACRAGNEAIAERGWPVNLVDLDRLAVRAAEDIRTATAKIERLAPPKGSEERVKPFVAGLKALDPVIERLTSTTEDFKTGALEEQAPKLGGVLLDVEKQSKKLGLRECAANDEHLWMADAIRAPVFAQQLADLDRRLTKRAKAISQPASTPAAAARTLERLSDLVDVADRGLSKLKPPRWASDEAGTYVMRLRDLASALDVASAELEEPALTPAEARAADKKLSRAAERERKAYKRLAKDLGAVPTLPGGDGGEAPESDESEAA